jgi:hypothetical protein
LPLGNVASSEQRNTSAHRAEVVEMLPESAGVFAGALLFQEWWLLREMPRLKTQSFLPYGIAPTLESFSRLLSVPHR